MRIYHLSKLKILLCLQYIDARNDQYSSTIVMTPKTVSV